MIDNSKRSNYAAFNLPAGVLAKSLKTVGSIISSRPSMPILENVLIQQENGHFTLTSCNMDAWIKVIIPEGDASDSLSGISLQEVRVGGKRTQVMQPVCLPYRQLMSVLSAMPSGMQLQCVTDCDKKELIVSYGRDENRFSLPLVMPDDFPEIKNLSEVQSRVEVPSEWFLSHLAAARTCVATDQLRPQMECVCFDLQDDHLCMVTASNQLLYFTSLFKGVGYNVGSDGKPGKPGHLLLHSNYLATLPFTAEDGVNITIEGGEKYIRLSDGKSEVVASRVETPFPRYQAVIPKDAPYACFFSRHTMIASLRRVMSMACKSSPMVVFTFGGEELQMRCEDVDFSRSIQESVPYAGVNQLPDGFCMAFNGFNLLSLLQNCLSEDEFKMAVTAPDRAVTLHNTDVNNPDFCLCMPIRLNHE